MPLAVDDELGKNRAVGGCRGSSSDPPLSRALGEEKGVGRSVAAPSRDTRQTARQHTMCGVWMTISSVLMSNVAVVSSPATLDPWASSVICT